MNTAFATQIEIKIQKKHRDEFYWCEHGAHTDEMTGPSPLTTCQILERSIIRIILRTPEEAAQVLDCCYYGTFPEFCPRVAERIKAEIRAIPGVVAIWEKYSERQWQELGDLIEKIKNELTTPKV